MHHHRFLVVFVNSQRLGATSASTNSTKQCYAFYLYLYQGTLRLFRYVTPGKEAGPLLHGKMDWLQVLEIECDAGRKSKYR